MPKPCLLTQIGSSSVDGMKTVTDKRCNTYTLYHSAKNIPKINNI